MIAAGTSPLLDGCHLVVGLWDQASGSVALSDEKFL